MTLYNLYWNYRLGPVLSTPYLNPDGTVNKTGSQLSQYHNSVSTPSGGQHNLDDHEVLIYSLIHSYNIFGYFFMQDINLVNPGPINMALQLSSSLTGQITYQLGVA